MKHILIPQALGGCEIFSHYGFDPIQVALKDRLVYLFMTSTILELRTWVPANFEFLAKTVLA